MKARNLVLASLAAFGVVGLPAAAAHALLVKVQINFGPTIVGPDNGTLIVQANPGDSLRITWALGTDTDIDLSTAFITLSGTGRLVAMPWKTRGLRLAF